MYKNILIGEYSDYFLREDGSAATYDNNKLANYPGGSYRTGSAGHPWACVIDDFGDVYHILGDSQQRKAVPINGAVSSTSYYTHHVVVGKDGSLTVYTDDLKNVKLKTPGKIIKAVAAADLLVLDDKGGVWKYEWIASGKIVKSHSELAKLNAERIPLQPATDIATSRSMFSAAIVNGEPWVWCDAFGAPYVGLAKATPPVNMGTKWGLTTLVSIAASDNVLHFLSAEGELYGMGNNWVGEVGNGEINPKVKDGNADMGNRTFVSVPVNISRGRKWKKICSGTYYAFRHFAQDEKGNWYSWGYAKFGLLANGIRPQDDPANVGMTAITRPHRIAIPQSLTVVSTADLRSGKVPYPPREPRVLIKTVKHYDDGSEEVEMA